jgi:hypothetical protein
VPTTLQASLVKERLSSLGVNCLSHVEIVDAIVARSHLSDESRAKWVASRRGRNLVLKYCLDHSIDVVVTLHRLDNYIPFNFGGEESVLEGYVNGSLDDMHLVGGTLHLGPCTACIHSRRPS